MGLQFSQVYFNEQAIDQNDNVRCFFYFRNLNYKRITNLVLDLSTGNTRITDSLTVYKNSLNSNEQIRVNFNLRTTQTSYDQFNLRINTNYKTDISEYRDKDMIFRRD